MHKKLLISLFFFTAAQQIFSAFPDRSTEIEKARHDLNAAAEKYDDAIRKLKSVIGSNDSPAIEALSELEAHYSEMINIRRGIDNATANNRSQAETQFWSRIEEERIQNHSELEKAGRKIQELNREIQALNAKTAQLKRVLIVGGVASISLCCAVAALINNNQQA